jgi:uncharacterized protein
MDLEIILSEFYTPGSKTYDILVMHSKQVAEKALDIAKNVRHLKPDMDFIRQAAMLHDIGIFMTDSPSLGCHGIHPYVAHGYLGRALLEEKNLSQHALVCERHVGAGITEGDIKAHNLPLPVRDMLPLSLEEKIICVADKFFSKDEVSSHEERSLDRVITVVKRYGDPNLKRFMKWLTLFGLQI